MGATAFATTVNVPDYRLDVVGLAASYDNRVEVSFARQRFDLGSLVHKLNLPEDHLGQDIVGLKVRLFGDLIYDTLPQVSLGLQYKHQTNFDIPELVGAKRIRTSRATWPPAGCSSARRSATTCWSTAAYATAGPMSWG